MSHHPVLFCAACAAAAISHKSKAAMPLGDVACQTKQQWGRSSPGRSAGGAVENAAATLVRYCWGSPTSAALAACPAAASSPESWLWRLTRQLVWAVTT